MEPQEGTDYMEFVYKFHRTMVAQKLTLVYEGEVNQSITKAFTSLAERNMDDADESTTIKKRVYHVMVECLQNICKHSHDRETGEAETAGTGIFMVGEDGDNFSITTGNVISNERAAKIQNSLDHINTLDQPALKDLHKKQMREAKLSSKGGAGLGLIDIARKTGNPLEYSIERINDETSFFILKTKINRQTAKPVS